MLLEEQVVHQQSVGPHVDLRAIGFFAEELGRHEDRCPYDFLVYLLLHCKAKVTQLVQCMLTLLLDEHVVGFDIPVHHFPLSDKLQSSSQLVCNLQGLGLSQRATLRHDVLEVSIRAELKDHGNVVLGEEAVEDAGGKEIVNI